MARLDGPAQEIRLLVDHRDDLVAERTRIINRLRWHLHELDPSWHPPARSLSRAPSTHLAATEAFISRLDGMAARIAGQLAARVRELNAQIDQLEADLVRVRRYAPLLLALRACGSSRRPSSLAEAADVRRFAYLAAPLAVGRSNLGRLKRLQQLFTQVSFVNPSLAPPIQIQPGDQPRPPPRRARWQASVRQVDLRPRLAESTVPTLVGVGRHDPQTPWPSNAEIAAALPAGRLQIFRGSGHYPMSKSLSVSPWRCRGSSPWWPPADQPARDLVGTAHVDARVSHGCGGQASG